MESATREIKTRRFIGLWIVECDTREIKTRRFIGLWIVESDTREIETKRFIGLWIVKSETRERTCCTKTFLESGTREVNTRKYGFMVYPTWDKGGKHKEIWIHGLSNLTQGR